MWQLKLKTKFTIADTSIFQISRQNLLKEKHETQTLQKQIKRNSEAG